MLLPYFIQHHSTLFDEAILIDYQSTDNSVEVISRLAPASWKIVPSRNFEFDAEDVDAEVMDYERSFPGCWKIALTTTEFLVHPDLRGYLASLEGKDPVLRFRSFIMVGNDTSPLQRFSSLIKQRSVFAIKDKQSFNGDTLYSRYLHRIDIGLQYHAGRHTINYPWVWAESGYISKFQWTPWPESKKRKNQIKGKLPNKDTEQGWQHKMSSNQIDDEHDRILKLYVLRDLSTTFESFSKEGAFSKELEAASVDWYKSTIFRST
jgi:hypothetical protein